MLYPTTVPTSPIYIYTYNCLKPITNLKLQLTLLQHPIKHVCFNFLHFTIASWASHGLKLQKATPSRPTSRINQRSWLAQIPRFHELQHDRLVFQRSWLRCKCCHDPGSAVVCCHLLPRLELHHKVCAEVLQHSHQRPFKCEQPFISFGQHRNQEESPQDFSHCELLNRVQTPRFGHRVCDLPLRVCQWW